MSTREIIYAAAGAGAAPTYIEDVFSTYLYTGNGSSQTITNGIDLAGKGGMVWIKDRLSSDYDHTLYDTVRGLASLNSNATRAQQTYPSGYEVDPFNSNGFTVNPAFNQAVNRPTNYVSWTFRKQAKFFDVVTYTGDGVAGRTVSHNLGSVPGMIIVKRTNGAQNWYVYHRSLTSAGYYLWLNSTNAQSNTNNAWNSTAPTSTNFTVGDLSFTNGSGDEYVAYLFAHDAGGFGDAGTDNIISCGSFTIDGSGYCPVVNLGYEPQYLLAKSSSGGSNWIIVDTMRGFSQTNMLYLAAQSSGAETDYGNVIVPTATGFGPGSLAGFAAGSTFIYMAIRRGPMKTPTSGTEVFSPSAVNVAAGTAITTGFPIDWQINYYRSFAANYNSINATRLLGTSSTSTESGQVLWTSKADAQQSFGMTRSWDNTGFQQTSQLWPNINNIYWNFRRAPGFFDVVCYTGTGATPQNVTHNLGVAPELMFVKVRSAVRAWAVYAGNAGQYLTLNATDAATSNTNVWGSTAPTSSVFRVGNFSSTNPSGEQIVAYLFATLAGVSKVGSYTGTGSTQTINAGLPTGARFVLIKRTDDVGNWWVWDTARGMVAGTDPRLNLNTTDAEINNNWVYTVTNGFQIVTSDATVNASGGSYIYLAIA